MKVVNVERNDPCPCGSGTPYEQCCLRFLSDQEIPETAETLMRSRYTAYALGLTEYLQKTWHQDTRPEDLCFPSAPIIRWLSLNVLSTIKGQSQDVQGTVEFIARFRIQGRIEELHEISEFTRHDGKWFYLRALGQSGN
jgi:SEC-C motif domain protein